MNSAPCAKSRHHRLRVFMGGALTGILFFGPAAAQDASWTLHPGLHDRWTIELGAYAPTVKTDARLDSPTLGIGTAVSFEDDLGLSDRKTMGTFLGRVRLGERWRIEAEYFALDRGSTGSISRTINWGGNVYTPGTVVTSEFNSDIFRLSAGYSFIKNAQSELGLALGLHVTDFTASLGAASVGVKTGDALAPLPTIGLYGAYAFTPRWLLSGRVDYFSLKYNEYDGSLTNFSAGVDYRFHRHFGVGVGYRYIDYGLDATKSNFTGSLQYQFSGPLLYGVGSF